MDDTLIGSLPFPLPRTGPDSALASPATAAPDLGPGVPPAWFGAALLRDEMGQLSRGRLRGAVPLDAVSFTAACPGCGVDAQWCEEREDTRLIARVDCAGCAG